MSGICLPQDARERMLHDANALAQRIRRARFKAGSLDLDFPESKIRLDERGKVLRIERSERIAQHGINAGNAVVSETAEMVIAGDVKLYATAGTRDRFGAEQSQFQQSLAEVGGHVG